MRKKALLNALVKLPKNTAEASFQSTALAAGWIPLRKGWPDYLCYKEGKMICVEVKPRPIQLDDEQMLVHLLLSQAGLDCYRWTPDGGFTKIFSSLDDVKSLMTVLLTETEQKRLTEEAKSRKGFPSSWKHQRQQRKAAGPLRKRFQEVDFYRKKVI